MFWIPLLRKFVLTSKGRIITAPVGKITPKGLVKFAGRKFKKPAVSGVIIKEGRQRTGIDERALSQREKELIAGLEEDVQKGKIDILTATQIAQRIFKSALNKRNRKKYRNK